MLTKINASTNEHLESWAQLPGSDLWNVQLAMFKETFKTNFNVKRQNVLQFCVTQGHMGQRAIAKKSSFLSQHETPPQLSIEQGGAGAVSILTKATHQLANCIRQGPQVRAVWVGEQDCINLANHLQQI